MKPHITWNDRSTRGSCVLRDICLEGNVNPVYWISATDEGRLRIWIHTVADDLVDRVLPSRTAAMDAATTWIKAEHQRHLRLKLAALDVEREAIIAELTP